MHIVFAALILISLVNPAWALSLGEIQVHSFFAQPLRAEISVPVFSEQELESLQIQLASREQFENEGLEYNALIKQLIFALRTREDGTPFITVTTSRPINDLTISFIVQVDWNGGSFVKSYDILLSPPKVSEQDAIDASQIPLAPKQEPEPSSQAKTETKPDFTENIAPITEPVTASPPTLHAKIHRKDDGDWVYGPVARGDTLSSIAEKFSAHTQLSFEHRKQILFKLNPQAFAGGRISQLQAGYNLTFREMSIDAIEFDSPEASPKSSRTAKTNQNPNAEKIALEAKQIQKEIDEKRELLKQYRTSNDELRSRLKELEDQVSSKAHELGIPVPPKNQ